MKIRMLLLFCLVPLLTMAQEKTYDIAVSYGAYASPILYHSQLRYPGQVKNYFSADFDYHLTKRWTISSGVMSGTFGYYDSFPVKLANGTYSDSDEPNSQGFDFHGYAMAKYALVATPRFNLQLATGIGFYTQRLEYPYEGNTYEASYAADFEVPISVEGFYMVAGRVGFGLKAGCFIQPEVRGIHIGPQLRIRL